MARKAQKKGQAKKSKTESRDDLENQLLKKIIAERILTLKILSQKASRLEPNAGGPKGLEKFSVATSAKVIVYRVLRNNFGDLAINDAMKLSTLGFDTLSLAGLAAAIANEGVPVDTAAIQRCSTVGEVVTATAKFM